MVFKNLPLVLFCLWIGICQTQAQDCVVNIQNGEVRGTTVETFNSSRNACAYLGIPFAAPPIGRLRFRAPQRPQRWSSINATSYPNWCPQAAIPPIGSGIRVSEDCLYLNVFVPKLNSSSTVNLPVMLWIYGGGFIQGHSYDYRPTRLLARGDVILVVPHYRVGLLGFLSTGDLVAPGNWGLKDQAYAVRWVNKNIRNFGGNPNQVTIFGQSAGSASVTYQLISPSNRGLIHGAIAQSGSALASWAIDRNPAESARTMGLLLGCPMNSSRLLINCLRLVSWERIVAVQNAYQIANFREFKYPTAGISPVVEPILNLGAFITEEPLVILKNRIVPNIPVMLGATKHDGSFVLGTIYLVKLGPELRDRNPDYMRNQIVPDLQKLFLTKEDIANRAVSSSIELAYLYGVNRSDWDDSMPGLVDMMTVFAFKSSVQNTADILSQRTFRTAPVYLYSFEHHSNNTRYDPALALTRVKGGIAHSDDLMYLFDVPSNFTENDRNFSEMMIDMWINFATVGNPTPTDDPRYEQWPEYEVNNGEYFMKLNVTPTVLSDYRSSWRPKGFE